MADDTTSGDAGDLTLEPPAPGRRPRGPRRALWAALAVVALAAGTVVVSTGGADGGPPVLPVSLSGAARELSADSAAGISLAWIRYVAGDDLPALGGEGTAHRLRPDVTTESMRTLAAALGLEGEIERDGLTWRIADGDRTLEVDERSGSWWYAAVGPDTPVTSDGSIGSGGGSTGCDPGTMDCTVTEPATATTFPADCTPNGCPSVPPDCTPGTDCRPIGPGPTDDCFEDCTAAPGEPCAGPECVTTLPVEECPPGADCGPTDPVPAPEPVVPEPAAGLPSEDEARAIALEVVRATGAEVDGARVTVDGPWDAWYVTVDVVLDEVPVSGWSTSVAVGPDGEVLHAGGLLATTEVLGAYPLIDTRAAIDRLNALQGLGAGASGIPVPAEDPPTASTGSSASGSNGGCEDVPEDTDPYVGPCPADVTCEVLEDGTEVCRDPKDPTVTTIVEPMPMPEPEPESEPLEVVLTGAERILVLLYTDDGSSGAYLVPGYRMTSDDGQLAEVAAVTDDFLSPTAAPETTAPPEPVVTEPAPPADCEVLLEDDGSGTTHTIQPCPPTSDASAEPRPLEPGEQPTVGAPYYVDVQTGALSHCGFISVELGDRWWWADGIGGGDQEHSWAEPTEGGTLTLLSEGEARFVGDAEATKVATLVPYGGPGERPLCA